MYFRGKYHLLLISVFGGAGRKISENRAYKVCPWKFIKVFFVTRCIIFLAVFQGHKKDLFFISG